MLPLQQAQELRSAISEYLKATFTFREKDVHEAFHDFVNHREQGIFRGPYVSVQLPFKTADQGETIPLDIKPGFTPFLHQSTAFKRLSSDNGAPEPTLLTTGTGSGKTESFLYPILDYCYKNQDKKGIKAIILYPMNALATDQAQRLAEMIWADNRLKDRLSRRAEN
jgi:DEAD/DEAH box helicase domain-containing protein